MELGQHRRPRTEPAPDRGWFLIVAGVLLVPSMAGAQAARTTPYQSQQRSLVGTGFGQVDAPRGAYVEPRAEVATQYASNINLAGDSGSKVEAYGLEFAPGIYASYSSDRVSAALDYSMIGRVWDDSDYNDLGHQLSANGRLVAVPDLLYVDGSASYGDTVIDPALSLNYGNMGIFGQQNLAEQATASVTPTLRKRFNVFEAEASYSYGRVWYLDQGKSQSPTTGVGVLSYDNSVDQSAHASFGTVREGHKLNGQVYYEWDKSEYDQALPYEYERAGVGASFLLARTLSLVGDVGRESKLDETTTQGGLDGDFWSVGLRWEPDQRTSAEARYGERFFGTSYTGSISHRARFIDVTVSYTEEPSVQTRGLSLGGFDPGTLPPGTDPGLDGGRLNAQPFLSKDAKVGVVAKGSRTQVFFNAYDSKRDYLRGSFGDEHGTGANVGATRRFASNFSVDATVSYMDISRNPTSIVIDPLAGSHDYDTQAVLRANREFGPRITASLETGYLNRSGSVNYDGWWIGLRGRWTARGH